MFFPVAFLVVLSVRLGGSVPMSRRSGQSTCAPLKNHGTHFTVEIEVGTPGQKFDVVADTGSDALIVTSCACVKAGYCDKKSRCFQGTNKSSTFSINEGPQGPPTVRMMFGSGPVQAVVASDTVHVGKLRTNMPDGILLMTDQLLNIQGQFEGILGLGLPSDNSKKNLYSQSSDGAGNTSAPKATGTPEAKGDAEYAVTDSMKEHVTNGMHIFPLPAGPGGSPIANEHDYVEEDRRADIVSPKAAMRNLAPPSLLQRSKAVPSKKIRHAAPNKTNDTGLVVKGFMEEAGIKRFSMCFNDGSSGVLRLGTPKASSSHGSIGQVHWGLDFRGVSIGDKMLPVEFCTAENMTAGQKTPCGAIPDSGTTAVMAPKEHILQLYETLCDGWARCKKNHTAMVKAAKDAIKVAVKEYSIDPFHIEAASKASIFQKLILDCRHWLTTDNGLDELPNINFYVSGSNGTKQTLSLPGWSYIIETQEKEFEYIYKDVPGLGKLPVGKNFTGTSQKVCSPAFSPMEYTTQENGPVWILGTPLFYEYRVGYDLSTSPPEISFSSSKCGSCGGDTKASFMSQDVSAHKHRHHSRQLRQIDGPFRKPNIDFSQPL